MTKTHSYRMSILNVLRPVALVVAVLGFLLATNVGPPTARAQPVLEFEAFCEPDPVRPNEPALMSCTVRWTNTGDETATSLQTMLLPSTSCNLPSPLFPPLIYQYRDGELTSETSLPIVVSLGDLGPGETTEAVTVLAVDSYGPGMYGAEVTATSQDDPTVTGGGDVCWTVEDGAAAPPTNLVVTKTLLTDFAYPPPEPFPTPPPAPDDGQPVPVDPPPGPNYPDEAEYEIVISNVGGVEMASLTVLDVQTGSAVLVDSDPPANGADALGRPTWDLSAFGLSSLPPDEELRILATVGPLAGNSCAYTGDVVVVAATPSGGEPEDYVAFADRSISIGDCGYGYYPDDFCWFYPPEGEPTVAPCADEVCWAMPPGGDEFRRIYECDPEVDYCWFVPPGDGYTELAPCEEEVCWFSFGEGDYQYTYRVSCEEQFCEYTAPDGVTSVRDSCDYPVCWSAPPEGGSWTRVWDCGEYADEMGGWCWFTAPVDGAQSYLDWCDYPPLFAVDPPEGAVLFGLGYDIVYFDGPACWPVPPDEGPFFTYVIPCGEVEYISWLRPPNDGPAFPVYGDVGYEYEYCWHPLPPYMDPPPGMEFPDDLLIPGPCAEGEEGKTGEPGSSVPAEVVDGISTPAEIVEGTSVKLDPVHSAEVIPADVVRTVRVENGAPDPGNEDDGEGVTPPPPNRDPEPQVRVVEVLGLNTNQSDADGAVLDVQALPDSGAGAVTQGPAPWAWAAVIALAAAGLVFAGAAAALLRRFGL